MSKELDEKQKILDSLLESKSKIQEQQQENIKILDTHPSIDSAYLLYQQGKVSEADFLSYKDTIEAIEAQVKGFPQVMQVLDTEIEQIKTEIKDLEQQEKKEGKKSFGGKERIRLAVIYLVACAAFTGLFGWFLSLLPPKVGFIEACKGVFWLFSAPMVVCAVLELLINIPDGLPPWVGFSLYYGTAILYMVPEWLGWYIPKFDRVLLGAAVCGVICYFAYKQIPHD